MTEDVSDVRIALICAAISLAVFAVDIASLPLGVAAGMAYVPAVVAALWFSKWQHTFMVAGVTTILTILGLALSEPAGVPWMVQANRLLAVAVIWLTALGGSWLMLARHEKANEELRHAEREAERARRAKMRFLQTASNDIRHHLQTLVLLNATLLKTIPGDKPQKMLTMQGDALAHMGDLMNSLLDLSEIESGDIEPTIEETRVEQIFDDVHNDFRSQAAAKNLHLEVFPTSEIVRTDRALLTQVLRSLVSNAIRYTDEGTVSVQCSRESGGLRIAVSDTGIGIEQNHLVEIFDEFYRVEKDSAGRNVGLGLGLTIVEHIVNLLEVSMDVESVPGQGSSFSLLVPAAVS